MMEIAAAISMASGAVNTIKRALEAGRDVHDISSVFGKWFDARDQITEADQYAKNPSLAKKLFSGSSVEAQALEITAAKHKAAALEKELREYLIWSGQEPFYNDMMVERRKIREARLREAKHRAEQKKFWTDIITVGVVTVISWGIVMAALRTVVSS